ncbi:MAG: hypothetical protein ACUVWP_07085 [bacterium]
MILFCSRKKKKDKTPLLAIERYDGGWIRLVRKNVLSDRDNIKDIDVYILSGRYGLIQIDYSIPYYEEREPHRRLLEKKEEVIEKIKILFENERYSEVYLLMGRIFKEVAVKGIPEGVKVIFCNGGYGDKMHDFLRWLKK